MMDIRPTSDAAVDYVWFGRNCLEQARRSGFGGAKAIRDGRWLVICKYTIHQATLITISQGDFAMHPRSGKVAKLPYYDSDMNLYTLTGVSGGGYAPSNDGFAQLAGGDPYPLRDNDHGTFVISVDGEEVEVEWAEAGEENYGNIWWTSAGDNPTTLSWRGPPSVQFPLPSSYSIPGLTQDDGTGGSTVFGCYIYQEGARIHGPQWFSDDEMATLIIGACYTADNAGTLWLVAIAVTRRDSTYWLQAWRSGDAGKTWQLLNEFAGSRARTPAFIAKDGKSFVFEGSLYRFDDSISSATKSSSVPADQAGTRVISGTGGYGSGYEFTGARNIWPGMDSSGNLVCSAMTQYARFSTFGDGYSEPTTTTVPVYRGNPATQVTLKLDSSAAAPCSVAEGAYGAVLVATADGNFCKAVWSGVDCCKDLVAVKKLAQCNSNYSATVTLQPQGISATLTINAATSGIVITGEQNPETLGVTYGYSASNAIGTVTWSNSKGTIDSNGNAVFAGCGSATITAVDQCGRSATLSIRLPSGVWRTTQEFTESTYNGGCETGWTEVTVDGGTRTTRVYANATVYVMGTFHCVDSGNCNQYTDTSGTQPSGSFSRVYENGTQDILTYYGNECPTQCGSVVQKTITLTNYKGVCWERIEEFLCTDSTLANTQVVGEYTYFTWQE